MRYPVLMIILALAVLLLSAGCKAGPPDNQQAPPAAEDLEKDTAANGAPAPSPQPAQADAEQQQDADARGTPARNQETGQNTAGTHPSAEQPAPGSVKEAPAPFPDDGKTANWRQSSKYPAYACHNSSLPQQLYTYSFDQGNVDSFKISLVKPVDFYCQTSPGLRSELLAFFKDFLTTYYTADYRNTDTWENSLEGFFDPKEPVATVNGAHPAAFIKAGAINTANNQLTITLTEILTDESLIYLDTNAHYRVRGRITQQAAASSDPLLPPGQHTFDVELAFKKKLLPGPDNWAGKDYVVTSLVKLH